MSTVNKKKSRLPIENLQALIYQDAIIKMNQLLKSRTAISEQECMTLVENLILRMENNEWGPDNDDYLTRNEWESLLSLRFRVMLRKSCKHQVP